MRWPKCIQRHESEEKHTPPSRAAQDFFAPPSEVALRSSEVPSSSPELLIIEALNVEDTQSSQAKIQLLVEVTVVPST